LFSISDPAFFTVNGLGFWIIIWVSGFLILGQVLAKIHLKGRFSISRKRANLIAITITLVATQFSLISYAGLFMHGSYTDICLAASLTENPVDEKKVMGCITKGQDTQLMLFLIGGITVTIMVFVQVWQLSRDTNE
jgi:hypothetical protein